MVGFSNKISAFGALSPESVFVDFLLRAGGRWHGGLESLHEILKEELRFP
jgi:hypothetical protein